MLLLAGHPFGTCLFLLLIPVASHMVLAKDDLFLEVTSFNSSTVDLACIYEGDEVDILFQLYKDGKACFHSSQTDSDCTYSTHHDCKFHCTDSSYKKEMSFLVNLNGSCNERMNIRCSVRSQKGLNLDTYHILKAQSDKPEILINNGQPVKVASTPVSISCSVTNICNKTELEISGVHVKSVTLDHYTQGNRFNAMANTTGIFHEPGNYTVTCRERGKEGQFAKNVTVEVQDKPIIEGGAKETSEVNLVAAVIALAVVSSLLACMLLIILSQRRRKKETKGAHEKEPLIDKSGKRNAKIKTNRKLPEMLQQEGICGIWIDEDDASGVMISDFIDEKNKEIQQTSKVNRAKFDEKWIIQEGNSYKGYFALISPGSLKNHNFMVYLTSVLCCSYLDRKFPVVLVLLYQDVLDNPNEKQDMNLIADLKALPQVDASRELDDDCLADIGAKLQESSVDTGIGNVGIGLAWSYFYGYLVVILEGIQKRIEESEYCERHGERMSKQFIIILPESGRTNVISEVDSRISTIKKPFHTTTTYHKAWHPHRSYKTYVHQIKMSQDDCYYFCGEYGTPMSSLLRMLEERKLTEVDMRKQLDQFTYTLRSILQNEPYRDKALVHRVRDVTKLADELCELITNPNGQTQTPMEIYPLKQVSRVAQGLVWSYFHHYLAVVGKGMHKRIKGSDHYHKRKMSSKVFILLPYSCDSKVLSTMAGNLTEVDALKRLEEDDPDYEEKYRTKIYEISADKQTYLACVEYCTRVQVLFEMEQQEPAVLSSMQKAAELRVFYEILYDKLYGSKAPDFCSNFELVYYNDEKNGGKNLSEILVDKIKESLQEEDTILDIPNNNTSV